MKRSPLLPIGLLCATAVAQDAVKVQVVDPAWPVRYTIESSAKSTTEREVLVDGEPMAARGGRGGGGGAGGATSVSQKVVFDEGKEGGAIWRTYHSATAKVERPGQDGEPQVQEIQGGMLGERFYVIEDDGGTVVRRGGKDGEEVPANAVRGFPTRTSFAGILPGEPVGVGEEFELPAGFVAAMDGLIHPVRPQADPAAAGGRGQGGRGAGGEQGARGQGGRGQGGRGMRGAPVDASFTLLSNSKLAGKIVGTVVEVNEGVAKIDFHGVREGEGSPADLGMGGGFGGRAAGGRGGRGGQGAGAGQAAPGEASAKLTLAGSIWVDTDKHSLVKLVVEGQSASRSHSVADRGGREMETTSTSEGTFRLAVTAAAAPEESKKKD